MKQLYLGNGYLGGVCEGLGEWSGIPPILWRILVLAMAHVPATIVIYVLIWIFVERKNN